MIRNRQKPTNDFHYKALWLTLILLMMFTLTQINIVSAFEWDNKVSYENNDKTALFENAFGLPFIGDNIARATLDTPKLNYVGVGENIKVMIFTIENYGDVYNDGLKDMEIYNMKTGKYEDKSFHWEFGKVIGQRSFNITEDINCDAKGENCEEKTLQTIYQDIIEWKDLDTTNVPKGNITIALVTDVKVGDHYDGIPILFGKKISRWAEWSVGLGVGLKAYYNMTNAKDARPSQPIQLANVSNTFLIFNETGCIQNDCLQIVNETLALNMSSFYLDNTPHKNFTLNFWFNKSNATSGKLIDSVGELTSEGTDKLDSGSLGVAELNTGIFNIDLIHMLTFTRNDTVACVWLDSVIKECVGASANDFTKEIFLFSDGTGVGQWGGMIDEMSVYNRSITIGEISDHYNSGVGITFIEFPIPSVDINLVSPADSFIATTRIINFSANATAKNSNITNMTLQVWNSDTSLFGSNFSVRTGTFNISNLSLGGIPGGNFVWNYEVCFSNTTAHSCNVAPINRSFNKNLFNISSFVFNVTGTEAVREHFTINISAGATVTSVTFNYNGTSSDADFTDLGDNNYSLEKELVLPILPLNNQTNNSFFFQVNFSDDTQDTTTRGQIVNVINLTICNPTNTIPYVNISFRNETTAQETITAIASTSWNFWISDKTINRTLNFVSSVESINYTFCFDPPNEKINVDLDMIYNNVESQQRSFSYNSQALTNTTKNQTLFLLPNSQGLFSPFQTVNPAGSPISSVSVSITRVLGGETIEVATGLTDGSGFATFFLNPDASHIGTFSKAGIPSVVLSFTPTTSLRTITMGISQDIGNTTIIPQTTEWFITPVNDTLLNETTYTFGFNVSSNQTITFISMNITNSTGDQVVFQSNAGQGFISENFNTGNNTLLIGSYIIRTSSETITLSKRWNVYAFFIGDYSIFRQGKLYLDYEFSNFFRLLIVLASIIGIIIFLSTGEITDTSESKVIVGLLMVWAFSIIGWLDTGLVVATTDENVTSQNINRLGVLSSQYGIALLSTVAGLFFVFRRLFIRRI